MEYGREQRDTLLKVLREEYGITTERELNEAIKKQGFINLAPFVDLLPSASQPPSRFEQ